MKFGRKGERGGSAAGKAEAQRSDAVGGRLDSLAGDTSRRGFLARVGGAMTAVTAGGLVARSVKPGEADAYHFCGHIYTTGSCPHPAGKALPRVDAKGFPLRPDGQPIDNLGRAINKKGSPVDSKGKALKDPDGRDLPPAPRTRVCDEVADKFNISTSIDGGWYRCCGGKVRKLVDCCSPSDRRINGDASLTGYCYSGRKVFCVLYFQTDVPC
ncbi:hypothetical protein HJD18_15290 [Thermoleophilia bacterium SCSIO 60948]|nr:hypothetical protein HJD18_15290 [Thermoleophilia bacterium SCSIO 60948]